MDNGKRIDVYLRQNGCDHRLTFRQERRLRHKANRHARQARTHQLDQTKGGVRPIAGVRPVVQVKGTKGCPTCGVMVGKCLTASGRPARNPHKGREEAVAV